MSDMRHGGKKDTDMRHGYFLNLTCDMVENKGHRHPTLAFLKIDMQHQDPPSRAPTDLCSLSGRKCQVRNP